MRKSGRKSKRGLVLGWMLLVASILVQRAGAQPPPLPATFYGTVTLDGFDAPEGISIRALINGVTVAQTQVFRFEGRSVYVLDVPGDDADTLSIEGGTEGTSILFMVGNAVAEQVGTWHDAATTALHLSATSPACTSSVTDDVNCDCRVDVVDLVLIAARYGIRAGDSNYNAVYDLNLDGRIDSEDIARAANNWKNGC